MLVAGDLDNKRSLNDAMRILFERHDSRDRLYHAEAIVTALKDATWLDYRDFFRRFVTGAEPIPLDEYLGFAGLAMTTTAQRTPQISRASGTDAVRQVVLSGLLGQ
jgi:predicted metalloprotease with PDZ domain